jgi:thiazole/oxazole-forming peptide maturase SagD family component
MKKGENLLPNLPEFFNTYGSISRVPLYNDEPKIFQYVADIHAVQQNMEHTYGYGSDFLNESALLKAVSEAIERTSLIGGNKTLTVRCSSEKRPQNFIEPRHFQPFTHKQLSSDAFKRMRVSASAELSWIEGIDASTNEEIWLPAQLVLCPYNFSTEPIIRFPTSNGAASGHSMIEARCRGALEVFERDAFMCWYLTAMPAYIMDLEDSKLNEDIKKIRIIYQRYKLELRILLLPSRWPFPVALAIIIDQSGVGPELTIGLKCHSHLATAIKGAVAEAQQMRPWLRDHMQLYGLPDFVNSSDIHDPWSRALFWARQGQHTNIDTLWRSAEPKKFAEIIEFSLTEDTVNWEATWNLILSATQRNQVNLYLINLSNNISRAMGMEVVKVVIPQAQPVYMDERFPYLNSESLNLAMDSAGPRWDVMEKDNSNPAIPPHPFS